MECIIVGEYDRAERAGPSANGWSRQLLPQGCSASNSDPLRLAPVPPKVITQMLERAKGDVAYLADDAPPQLLIVVHTEEEFDWSAPFDRSATATSHIRAIPLMHEVFIRRGAKPTYVIDFPVASQSESVRFIKQLLVDDCTTLGAHLHPWVSPPYEEEISSYNSYPGNLAPSLERAKIATLSAQIEDSFGVRPTVYLAGRYGYGPNTEGILKDLGYEIDMSPAPLFNYTADGGPDYTDYSCQPFWTLDRKLLRIPHTVAEVGFLCRDGKARYHIQENSVFASLRVSSVLARIGGIRRLRLSPEGFSLRDMRQLTKTLFRSGIRIFLLAFHSPSLAIGHTPYVRDSGDLARFNRALESYLTFFRDEMGGLCRSPGEIKTALMNSEARPNSTV